MLPIRGGPLCPSETYKNSVHIVYFVCYDNLQPHMWYTFAYQCNRFWNLLEVIVLLEKGLYSNQLDSVQ